MPFNVQRELVCAWREGNTKYVPQPPPRHRIPQPTQAPTTELRRTWRFLTKPTLHPLRRLLNSHSSNAPITSQGIATSRCKCLRKQTAQPRKQVSTNYSQPNGRSAALPFFEIGSLLEPCTWHPLDADTHPRQKECLGRRIKSRQAPTLCSSTAGETTLLTSQPCTHRQMPDPVSTRRALA